MAFLEYMNFKESTMQCEFYEKTYLRLQKKKCVYISKYPCVLKYLENVGNMQIICFIQMFLKKEKLKKKYVPKQKIKDGNMVTFYNKCQAITAKE